jgi:hypothetical protein
MDAVTAKDGGIVSQGEHIKIAVKALRGWK